MALPPNRVKLRVMADADGTMRTGPRPFLAIGDENAMDNRIVGSLTEWTVRLSRRAALKAYTPPALTLIALANANGLSTSGVERVRVSSGGGGNGGGGNGGGGNGGGGNGGRN